MLCSRITGVALGWIGLTVASCSSQPRPLSYHGIAIGMRADSLHDAVQILTAREPFCIEEGGYNRCTSATEDGGTYITAYVQHGVLKDVQVRRTLTASASTDSLRGLFAAAWGNPDSLALPPRDWLPGDTTFVSISLGRWRRRGVEAWVLVHSQPHNPLTEYPFGFLDVQMTQPGFRSIMNASTPTDLAP